MEYKEYKLLKDRESFFWWNVGRRNILKDALRRHTDSRSAVILDIGCGPGGNSLFLKDFGVICGVDPSNEALQYARTETYQEVKQGSATELPFKDGLFDIVAVLDVIEHVEDDTRALKEVFRVLKPGGFLLLTVPAYKWMWSKHDEALHHKRRYEREELKKKVIHTGLRIKEFSNFVIPSIPFRALKIFIRSIKKFLGLKIEDTLKTDDVLLPSLFNNALIFWLTIERHCMRVYPLPWGSSILVVAKKPL